MAPVDSTVRKLPEPAAPQYRTAPHNIEAEQALLGAILVNNEAFYRVSDFLEPRHFFEPIHQTIYELAVEPDPRRQGGDADHAEDLPAGRNRVGGLNAASISPASPPKRRRSSTPHDYGRTICDLAMRRT